MKKSYFICLVLFLFSCSKNKHINKEENKGADSVAIYIRLIKNETPNSKRESLYLTKALALAIKQKNDSINRNHLLDISTTYLKEGNKEGFETSSNLLFKESLESKDTFYIAQYYKSKAEFYKNISVNDSAFICYLKSEKLFRIINDKLNLGSVLSYKSIIQYTVGDFVGADKSLTEAYQQLKNLNDKDKLYIVFTMMGIVASETKDFDKAIQYYTKSLKLIDDSTKDSYKKATCINNIGYVYQNKGSYKEAIKNYLLALRDTTIKDNDPELYSLLIDNLAYCKFKINDLENLPNLFFESLKIRENINAQTLIVLSNIHLSEFYFKKKDYLQSQKFANQALKLATKTGVTRDFLAAVKQASIVDFKNSSKYKGDYIRINDSIQDVERLSKEKFSRLQLETDEIIQEKDVLEDKNRTLLYIFIITVALASLLFVVRAQRARTRELLLKQAQQKANEEIFNLMMSQQSIIDESRNKEKKRLAQDLHDGVLGRMFGLRLNLDSLNSSDEAAAKERRHELLNELKTIEQDIREISHDLNREKLVLINNFVSIVHNLLEEQKLLHEAGVTYHIDTAINWDKIGNAIKINLYRILQEGLQNINKYAKAKNITVEISGNSENVFLKIEDDGIGFDVSKKSKGIGMQNMISRTNDCKGIIDISSKIGEGSKIVITVPIETKSLIIEEA